MHAYFDNKGYTDTVRYFYVSYLSDLSDELSNLLFLYKANYAFKKINIYNLILTSSQS